ncbi:hypothetical protein H632_c89p2 [Helicosporidium sp. ATCC 50920]|nr:hypothetical protein H632_c89p2 [Helicosporidium sp. ATCC 50920]|eukprot:KDD76842.1 hypothetical protein H632_c89p2 [Helicosporidium sp. ATCC 50920]
MESKTRLALVHINAVAGPGARGLRIAGRAPLVSLAIAVLACNIFIFGILGYEGYFVKLKRSFLSNEIQQRAPVWETGNYDVFHGPRPFLPRNALERSFSFLGSMERMHAFADKLMTGASVHVVMLGGSTTAGRGAYLGHPFASRFGDWINGTWPVPPWRASHRLSNRGMGATPSALFNLCFERMVPGDGDLYVVEFAINDAWDAGLESGARLHFEQLLRRLVQLPGCPAVAVLATYSYFKADKRFYQSAETDMGVLARYYDVPVLSMRNAVWPLLQADVPGFSVGAQVQGLIQRFKTQPGTRPFERRYLYADPSHPSDLTGHRAIAEMLQGLVRRGVREWRRRRDACARCAALPAALPPMLRGNVDAGGGRCWAEDELADKIEGADGFELAPLKPEAATRAEQKWGWSADRPGAWIEFRLDTLSRGRAGRQEERACGAAQRDSLRAGWRRFEETVRARSVELAREQEILDGDDRRLQERDGMNRGVNATTAPVAFSPPPPPRGVLAVSKTSAETTDVVLGYHRSWEGMGRALVTCLGGCACDKAALSGHWDVLNSQTSLATLTVSRAKDCRLRIKVLRDTHSEGHLFVLRSIIVSDTSGTPLPYLDLNQGDSMLNG